MTFPDGALRLRPATADEVPAWIADSKAGYAHGIESHGGQTHEAAQLKAEEDTAAALPLELDTPGHAILVVEADGRPIGRLWLAERESGGRRTLFVYDISIDDAFRGRGYGRAVMRSAEDEARARGLGRIELNANPSYPSPKLPNLLDSGQLRRLLRYDGGAPVAKRGLNVRELGGVAEQSEGDGVWVGA